MAINKKLIHFKTKLKFLEELAKGNILNTSIVFILDTTEIYTHGQLYDGSTFDPTDIEASIQNLLNNKVDKVTGKGLSTNDYTTTEKNKLAGIASGAEVNVQSDWNVTDSKSDAYIKNKPSLSTVATSGSYNDLSNKPSIDSALSTTSTNSVLNKAITIGINAKYTKPSTGIPKSDLASSILTSLGKADTALLSIPSEYITETELAAKGYTTNIGTITGIKMNGASKGTSGVVDLGTVITSHQDISGKLDKTTAASTYLTKTDAATTYLGISAKAANATKADSATKATQDARGNVITSTYATKTSVNNIQTLINTLVSGDANTAIESFNEIIAFLEGVEDTETLDGIIAGINTEIAKKADKSSAITNITRSGTTFTATRADGTTFKFNLQDNNTTYTFSGGTNKFTVTPSGGSAQTVLVTPSIANNITGSGTSGYLAKFNGANTVTNGPALGSSTSTYLRNDGTWATPPNSNTIPSAYCSTAAGTAAKAASCSGYVLTANTYLHLNLTAANSAKSALTLNVNSTGAKNIYINGSASSSSNYTLPAGTYVVFYDGTQFQLRTDGMLPGKILAAKNADTVNGLTVQTAVPANAKFTDNNTTYTFAGGTNKFTVTPSGGSAQTVTVTPSISKNVTYTGTLVDELVATFEGTSGTIKASGYTIAKSVPRDAKFTDTNTHYTSKNIVGASSTATANATASNGSVYLNHLEESTVKSAHLIKGTGATTVTSDSRGNITINSTDTNTWRSISDSVSSTSSDVSASSKAVKTAYDLAASKTSNTGTVTSVTPGTGLTGTSSDAAITSTGTINLKSAATGEIGGIKVGTVNSSAVTTKTEGSNYYPVNIDSNSKAYVALPTWSNNSGTITGIKMNGSSKGTSGVVDLGTVITSHQDISGKADKSSLATVATSGSYNDLKNKPTIPSAVSETTVSGWGFTKNTGTYTKPSTGIPVSDLTSAIQISLDKADTALQSIPSEYVTETELVNKGYATASELNTKLALKANKTDLPTKVSNLTNDSNFASATDRGIDVGGLNVMDARLGSDRVYFASHAQATYLSDGRDVETAVNSIETIASEASVISSEAKVNAAAAVASVSTLSGLANATTAMETLAGQVTLIQLNKESIADIYATIDGYDTTEIFYGTCNATSNTKTYTKIMSNVTEVGPCKIIAETNLRYTGKGNNTFVGLFYLPTGTDDLKSANTITSIDGGATGVITPAGTLLIEYPGSGPINPPVDIYVGSRFSGTLKVVFEGEKTEGLLDKVNDNTTAIRQHENRLTDLGSDVSLVSSGVQALKNDVEELQQLIVGENGDNNLQTIYVNGKGSTSKTWDLLLSNVTQTPPIIITAETDIVYTGSSGSTFLSLDSAPAGTSTQPSSLITPISGTAGQVIPKGTIIFNYAGQPLPEAKDVYIGVRYSGTLKIVIGEEKEVVLGLSDQVKKNTADIANNSARITALESNPSASTSDIISLYQDQILRARQLGYRSSKSESIYPVKPLVFMHISDTHTSKPNTRAIQILNYLGANGNVKFLMHTGDMLEDPKRNPPAWSSIVSAAQYPVFVTSGNHDVGNWATATSQYRTDDQFYAAFITPQINSWGLKTDGGGTPHPSGKNYYFTDFTEEKIRFIVVYEYEIPSISTQTDAGRGARWISQEQTNWFINTLLTTPAGYGVIIAKHAPDGLIGDDRNPFNSFYKDGENTQQSYQYRDGAAYTAFFADIVQAFMDKKSIRYTVTQSAASYQGTVNVSANFSSVASGVEFICYVSGHVHADNISFLQTHPKQLELNINCDNTIVSNQRSETLLIEGTRFEDAINVYSIDRNYGKIHVLRIGADYDAYGNRKDLMTINYRQ